MLLKKNIYGNVVYNIIIRSSKCEISDYYCSHIIYNTLLRLYFTYIYIYVWYSF